MTTQNSEIPTFAKVQEAIESLPVGTRQRDLKSAVSALLKVTGKSAQDIPAVPRVVRKLLEDIPPLAHGYSERRWANIRSGVTKALGLVRELMPSRNTEPMASEWQALMNELPDKLVRKVSPALRWLGSNGVLPATIAVDDLQRYCEAIEQDRMRSKPEQAADHFLWAWNRAVAACPDWPQVTIPRTTKREVYTYPFSYFPASLEADVKAYTDRLSQGALFAYDDEDDDDFDGPIRPVRPATVVTRTRQLRTAASCLARSGIDAASITSIAVLVERVNFKKILHFLMQRNPDGKSSTQVAGLAGFLAKVALYWVKVDHQDYLKLKRLTARVAVQSSGMTAKNRERLRPFDDDHTVIEFVCLPDTIRKAVEKSRRAPRQKALLAQMAAAIALQMVIPMRIANLASIDMHRHLVANRNGIYLVIPEAETKNRQPINFQLPAFALEVIKWYMREYRHFLVRGESTALFPGQDGGHKAPHTLGLQIKQTIFEFTGLHFNVHLFRHTAAKLFLDANPGNYEVVRQLLRHSSITTTTSAYSGAETRKAGLLYAGLVESLRAAHAPRSKPRPQ